MKRIAEITDRLIRELRLDRSATHRPRVLVVEDEEPVAKLLEQLLTQLGCRVTVDRHGVSAHEEFGGDDPPEIVFLDLMLPHTTGLRVLRKIRDVSRDTPVVIVTGFPDSSQIMEAAGLGYVGVVAKPLAVGAVQETLAKHRIVPRAR